MPQYQVLARKYRPKNFSQLLGQSHVWHALSNAVETGRLHHAYLFTGTRGVGKTTIARILAKCLNCETGITSKPCGQCDACMNIDDGRFIDLIEIDAASRTKVEDTRDLLENVPYAPTQGRYKVYLIDEVHMLSTHSFNALLKTLEEPPEHVKFILATTDPQKIPITIVSRCLQFVLRPLSQEQLHAHLSHILSQEHIDHTDRAVWQLAESAKGSVRDALSLTDQAIAFGGGAISDDGVNQMLGLVGSLDILSLIDDIYVGNTAHVANHITRLRQQMADAVAVLDRLVNALHELAIIQYLPLPMDKNDEQKLAFEKLAQKIPAEVLQLYYEIAIKTRDGVRLASTPMQALEMGILRLLAFRPLTDEESVHLTHSPSHEATQKHDPESQIDASMVQNHHQSTNTPVKEDILEDEECLNHPHDEAVLRIHDNDSVADISHDGRQNILPKEGMSTPNDDLNDDVLYDETIKPSIAIDEGKEHLNADLIKEDQDLKVQQSMPVIKENQNSLSSESPKSILQAQLLAPPIKLEGEWNAQKWDYWLSVARHDGLFDNDELALLNHSQMVGSMNGISTLCVDSHNAQVTTSFNSAKAKICERLPKMTLVDELPILTDEQRSTTPYIRQQEREAAVIINAKHQIIESPVVQQLWQQGYIINDGRPILSSIKLTLDS
ncbi:DNA polymerase III subunit gamma/tau [Moraxella oculi]|uniref:DNA polymerase III subunit gamma/tau n=1 Tax=Moraxella oculi TaxID=2940516 RepID=A0ABW8U3J8_9GAMM